MMLTDKFLAELHQLSYADKLRIVQALVHDLAVEADAVLDTEADYAVWSPYDSAETAAALTQMLDEDRQQNG